MALDTPVNSQITDAVTQANVKVLGDAPAMAMGAIYQSLAHSTGILYENAAAAQQQQQVLAQAATNVGVMQLYSAATAGAAGSDVPDNLLSLLSALRASSDPGAAIAAARQAAEAIMTPLKGAPRETAQAASRAAPAAKAKPRAKPAS